MRNMLRVIMLVLIAVAVYYSTTFLIGSNNTYPEKEPENVTKNLIIDSGENSEKIEEKDILKEEVEKSSEKLEEEDIDKSEEVVETSGEIIENAIVDPSGEYQIENMEEGASVLEDK